uniref:Uncharacterized protein n=1 Tax=Utricularia reniformis TaxID=192314 RepID=A0A1Y0B1J6_9LAMI|nr:hypothetical protein AEK19_MT1006 [Utricularia reniformis]ART31229.1 hypothetical protein AEK19_MT1006 [Utricularia reniformis]
MQQKDYVFKFGSMIATRLIGHSCSAKDHSLLLMKHMA